jgi:hypothetical protein
MITPEGETCFVSCSGMILLFVLVILCLFLMHNPGF